LPAPSDATPRFQLVLTSGVFPPVGPADRELEWFFTMAECDMGLRSNFTAILPDPPDSSIETGAEAVHAHRRILRWLTDVGDPDAGVLEAAYAARPWPLRLREELGRVTGVVVRLATAEDGMPDDDAQLDALERRTAERLNDALALRGADALARFRGRGLVLLRRAFIAYERARGGPRVPAIRGIS
jgi:hypothetical protein